MNTGMLWDLHTNEITVANIMEAKNYYATKFGIAPNLCYYSDKSELPEDLPSFVTKEFTLIPSSEIPQGHLWLGVKKTEEEEKK